MNSGGLVRIEALNKDNYDSWKMQMEALLVKNDAWLYVNGERPKPERVDGNEASEAAERNWTEKDSKAKSDLILSISASELKQIKGCKTSREIWLKLESIYQSKGPARKATLLKRLTIQKMEAGGDVRDHMAKFFDAVDKLTEMDVVIHPDLLSVMLLYSLPAAYENFRCAIESRDELPSPEILRVKILEENDARTSNTSSSADQEALAVEKKTRFKKYQRHKFERSDKDKKPGLKCFGCGKLGHRASECWSKGKKQSAYSTDKVSLYANFDNGMQTALHVEDDNPWCLDSGCTSHLCKDKSAFTNIDSKDCGELNLASDKSITIRGKGSVVFSTDIGGRTSDIEINKALYVPDLRVNLLSVAKITDRGHIVTFDRDKAKISDRNGNIKLIATRKDDLYLVREKSKHECRTVENQSNALKIWHHRLGHLNVRDLQEAIANGTIRGMHADRLTGNFECETCIKGKMSRPAFPKVSTSATDILELIHTDICGPMRVTSNGEARYFITFIDDSSRWCEVYFLKTRDQALEKFQEYKAFVENKHNKTIKRIRSDNGREFISGDFESFLKKNGIKHELSAPYSPQQNGIAERMNRTLVESARCSLIQTELQASFWAEAISTACYVRNRCPTKSLASKTPYEKWIGRPPNVNYFRRFGSEVYCLDRLHSKGKFQPRSRKGILLGYSDRSKAYKVWIPEARKIEVTRDVKFLKDNIPSPTNLIDELISLRSQNKSTCGDDIDVELASMNNDLEDFEDEPTVPHDQEMADEGEDQTPTRRGPGRPKIVKTGRPGRPRKKYQERKEENTNICEAAYMAEVPTSQALSSAHSKEWMASEVKSLIKMNTWDLIDRPDHKRVIGSRMVLRNKYTQTGEIDRRKARVVAQGFLQRPGIDFHEVYAPVARLSSIRMTCAIAARIGMKIRQFDVTTAYLNSPINEEIYMEVPEFLEETIEFIIRRKDKDSDIHAKAKNILKLLQQGDKVCRLNKALYGLRQSGRSWLARLDKELQEFGVKASHADPCVYHAGEGEKMILIVVYVDDILVLSKDLNLIKRLNTHLSKQFEMRDLGEVQHCLGLEFGRNGDSITLRQSSYIRNILERFDMSDCKPISTPIEVATKLTKDENRNEEELQLPYRELVGSLMYLAVGTRPDIMFAVSHLSQFNDYFGKSHWIAAKRVLRYLKGTIDYQLEFKHQEIPLVGYSDADWGGCIVDRRSYTGYAFLFNGVAVTWNSKKQRTVALSSTEAEYMSLTEASKEAIYLQDFLNEIGLIPKEKVTIFCDNMGASKLGKNPAFHARTKHIDIKHHFVREVLANGTIQVDYVPTDAMVADVLTKGLTREKHNWCVSKLGLN